MSPTRAGILQKVLLNAIPGYQSVIGVVEVARGVSGLVPVELDTAIRIGNGHLGTLGLALVQSGHVFLGSPMVRPCVVEEFKHWSSTF